MSQETRQFGTLSLGDYFAAQWRFQRETRECPPRHSRGGITASLWLGETVLLRAAVAQHMITILTNSRAGLERFLNSFGYLSRRKESSPWEANR